MRKYRFIVEIEDRKTRHSRHYAVHAFNQEEATILVKAFCILNALNYKDVQVVTCEEERLATRYIVSKAGFEKEWERATPVSF